MNVFDQPILANLDIDVFQRSIRTEELVVLGDAALPCGERPP